MDGKPILEYAENISNQWSDILIDSVNEISDNFVITEYRKEFKEILEMIIEQAYREGYKDGLALSHWLENGCPKV